MNLDDNYMVMASPQMAAKVNEVLARNAVSFLIDGKVEEARH